MRFNRTLPIAGLMLAAALVPAGPAAAAPILAHSLPQAVTDAPQTVQYRGYGYGHRGYGHGGWGHRHRGYGGGAAVLGGLAAGAIIGGAIAHSQARAADAESYCAQSYRSYDPASGTYLNNDGNRYPCP